MRFSSLALLTLLSCGGIVESEDGQAASQPGPDPAAGRGQAAAAPDDAPPCTTEPSAVETIADLAESPGDLGTTTGPIAVDDRYVYADTNRGLFRVSKCGGAAVRIAENAPGQYAANGLVQDSAYLYLAANAPVKGGFVRRVAKDGSGVTELASSTGELFGLALAASPIDDRTRLYWVEKGSAGTLRARRMDDGVIETVATIPIAFRFGPFAVESSGVTFFAQGSSNYGTFYRHPWSGISEVGRGASPYAMVSDGTTVHFTFGHTGANGIAHLTSAPGERVADAAAPCGLARREDVLYWSDMSLGTVQRCRLSGATSCGEAEVIASGEADPRHVAVDERALYWATRRGVLRRAPR